VVGIVAGAPIGLAPLPVAVRSAGNYLDIKKLDDKIIDVPLHVKRLHVEV
jgi:hypothetical protein